jgi:bacterial/archaeal transporter family protein
MNFSWVFWASLSAIFAALTSIYGKMGVQTIDSDLATLIRTGIVFVILLMILGVLGKLNNLPEINQSTWTTLTLSAIGTGASWLCFYKALKLGDASKVIVVDKFSLILVMLIATIFLGEKNGLKEWIGAFMVTLGMTIIVYKPTIP